MKTIFVFSKEMNNYPSFLCKITFDIYVVSNNQSFLLSLPVIYKIIINEKLLDTAKIQNTEYIFLGDMFSLPMPNVT